MQELQQDYVTPLLSEFNTKIADLDERQNMIRERVLISDQSFIKSRDNMAKEIRLIKDEIREVRNELEESKEVIQHLLSMSESLARKDELQVIERQFKLWEPLKFVRESEVKKLVQDALSELIKPDEKG